MKDQERSYKLVLLLGIAGLTSALLDICLAYSPAVRYHFALLPGTLFGGTLSACFALCGYFRRIWNMLAIPATTTLAYYVSFLAGGAVEFYSPFGAPEHEAANVSAAALFAGGVSGALLILGVVSLFLGSEVTLLCRVTRALYRSPLGGVLGMVGWALGPSLGMALWSAAHFIGLTVPTETFQNALYGQTSRVYSLWVVWQTGLGILLGLLVSHDGSPGATGTSVGQDRHQEGMAGMP